MYDDSFLDNLIKLAIEDTAQTEILAASGQILTRRRHTIEARLRYIWSIFNRMHAGLWSIRDQFDLFLASERGEDFEIDLQSAPDVERSTQLEDVGEQLDVILKLDGNFEISSLRKAIGPNPQSIAVVAPTVTQGERVVAQLSQFYHGVDIYYRLSDRTITERIAHKYDCAVVINENQVEVTQKVAEIRGGWSHSPEITTSMRQNTILFWHAVEEGLKLRFGSSLIYMTIDENFDHVWGGVSFWIWASRKKCARVRVERLFHAEPVIGYFRQDKYSDSVIEQAKLYIEQSIGDSITNDHWHLFFLAANIDAAHYDGQKWDINTPEARLVDVLGYMLRLAFDDVCHNVGGGSPM
jgi:hypothetical protein